MLNLYDLLAPKCFYAIIYLIISKTVAGLILEIFMLNIYTIIF